MTTPSTVDATAVIAKAIAANVPMDLGDNLSSFIAERVMAALARAGVTVLNPQDVSWGTCPDTDNGTDPHEVALNLCAYCLEYDPS